MAQLPGGDWLIQQIAGEVVLFNRHDEREIVRFDPGSANEAAIAQGTIAHSLELDSEQKSFAHFWSGYFYAHAATQSTDMTVDPLLSGPIPDGRSRQSRG